MKQQFKADAKASMDAGASVEEFHSLLLRAAESGLSRAEAQSALEELRNEAASENAEDRILEVLDIVTDYCAPGLRVPWKT